ncbi:MAG TPA: hypothetical protein VIW24_06625 [Aldersonia sp.]
MLRNTVRLAIVAAAIAAAGFASAGTAAAEVEVPMTRCLGLSPYIIDQPYAPARMWLWQNGPGHANLAVHDVASLWFLNGGYRTEARLDWRNLDSGAGGTEYAVGNVGYPGGGAARFDFYPGSGNLEVTLSAYNSHALWGFPTTTCTGTVHVD